MTNSTNDRMEAAASAIRQAADRSGLSFEAIAAIIAKGIRAKQDGQPEDACWRVMEDELTRYQAERSPLAEGA